MKAKETISLGEHTEALRGVECRKDRGVLDERPTAYKSIDAVMDERVDGVEQVRCDEARAIRHEHGGARLGDCVGRGRSAGAEEVVRLVHHDPVWQARPAPLGSEAAEARATYSRLFGSGSDVSSRTMLRPASASTVPTSSAAGRLISLPRTHRTGPMPDREVIALGIEEAHAIPRLQQAFGGEPGDPRLTGGRSPLTSRFSRSPIKPPACRRRRCRARWLVGAASASCRLVRAASGPSRRRRRRPAAATGRRRRERSPGRRRPAPPARTVAGHSPLECLTATDTSESWKYGPPQPSVVILSLT